MSDTPKLWTVQELANEAHFTMRRIRQLLQEGKISGFKAGRDWLVSDEEARRFLAERQVEEKEACNE